MNTSAAQIVSPAGTYLPSGATAPVADPGGTYSAAGATAPTTDPAGTYSSPYALDRLVIVWQNNTPANVVLSFTSLTAVENYYGATSSEATLAKQFFAGYKNAPATLSFTREALGQRPHLLGANIDSLSLPQLQAIKGPLSVSFDGYNYTANVNLKDVTSFASAALKVQAELNHTLPVAAVTTGDTITSKTVRFTGYFSKAQLYVTSVQPGGVLQVGGRIYGKGVLHYDTTNNQLIYDHTGTPGGPGHYSTFGRLGSVSAPGEAMKETYGVLTIGAVTSGAVAVGDEVSGAGIPPLTAILADLGNGQWLVNNAVNVTGDITITAPPLTVKNNFVTGATQNNQFFEIQPNGAFGFDQNPSSLSYATGTAADALGLSQAVGAIDSTPGGQHPTITEYMDSVLTETNQLGQPVQFGSFQTNDPRLEAGLATWAASSAGAGLQFIASTSTTTPAGSSLPVTDPTGTYSAPGASAPTLAAPSQVPNVGTTETAFDTAVDATGASAAVKNEAKQFEANVWGSDSSSKFVVASGQGLEFWIETPKLQFNVQIEPTPSELPTGLTQSESVFQSEINAAESDTVVASTLYHDIYLAYGGSLGSGAAVATDGTTAFGSVYEPTVMTTIMVHPR